jgi:O-antigen ligase
MYVSKHPAKKDYKHSINTSIPGIIDILIYFYIFLIPIEPIFLIKIRGVSLFNITKPLGIIIFILWITQRLLLNKDFKNVKLMLFPSTFALMSISSALWAKYFPEMSFRLGLTIFMNVGLFFMLFQFTDSLFKIVNIYVSYLLGSLLSAVLLLKEAFITNVYQRFSLYNQNQGIYPATLVLGFFFLIYLTLTSRRNILRFSYIIMMIILYFAALLSGTRSFIYTSFVIFPIFLFHLTLKMNSKRKGILISLLLMIILALSSLFVFQRFEELRLRISTGFYDYSFFQRVTIARNTLYSLTDNPLLGLGFGNFPYFNYQYSGFFSEAHNVFISIIQDLGILGFILFIVFYSSVFKKSLKLCIISNTNIFSLVTAYSFFMMSIISFSEPLLKEKSFWIVLSLVVSHYFVSKCD